MTTNTPINRATDSPTGPARRTVLGLGAATAGWFLVPTPALAAPSTGTPPHALSSNGGGREVPHWYDANRVQGHTRLMIDRYHDTPQFSDAAERFQQLGAGAFTRHAKFGDEQPWWPTALPLGPDGNPLSDHDRIIRGVEVEAGRNIPQEYIDYAHSLGMRVIAYYWHMSEAWYRDNEPSYICRTPDGDPIEHGRGTHLDITGPYGDVVVTRLRELAAMGVDGFFFDENHLPPSGSWGSALEEAWEAETGTAAPVPAGASGALPTWPPATWNDASYLAYLDFRARRIEDTFQSWMDDVKADYPEVVFIISTTEIAGMTRRGMTTRLARIADSAKNEFDTSWKHNYSYRVFLDYPDLLQPANHVRQALSFSLMRDSSDGRPPLIWVTGLPNADHAEGFASSVLTFGGVASMDTDEGTTLVGQDPPPWPDGLKTPIAGLEAAFELGNAVSPRLAGTRPVRWAAVHYSERIRNAREGDFRAAWEEVIWPTIGVYQTVTEDGLPIGIVNDHQLAENELDGYQVLILPNPTELTGAEQAAVDDFTAGGGAVIAMDPSWEWSTEAGNPLAAASLRSALAPHTSSATVQVVGGPAGRYGIAYQRQGHTYTVAITNDFSWVQDSAYAKRWEGEINPAAPPAEGVSVHLRDMPNVNALVATDAVSGEDLDVVATADGVRVDVPAFDRMACIVVSCGNTNQPS
ncbi:hypothetical protein IM660_18145 [Ruania alkalisoli]|uniref:Uncharacterized protein n=1 Tax=Ruania alkalisoli TaxID=2779775 RepID=A0A7M1SSG1_9MICO|nr:hypothetical protein [Ruania alkalisoli]QOR70486.1 hypothetical protein IM660_18145 [Ruania alkalisoli]